MTVPAPAPGGTTAALAAIAHWDVPLLRRTVALLAGVAERLSPWRARLQGVGRVVDSGETWCGPAARTAAEAVTELAAVAWAVDDAVARSLAAYRRLVDEAGLAHELAVVGLRGAGDVPATAGALLAGSGVDAPALFAAEEALDHARRAAAAAEEAGSVLSGLGVHDAFVPARFDDLAAELPLVGPVPVPRVPSGGSPADVAGWWADLGPAAQRAAIAWAPDAVGALDGVPAWARDQANRRLLDRALRDPDLPDDLAATAAVVARTIAVEEAAGEEVQLQLLDLPGDRVALGLGNLDTADAVGVLVPGILTSPADDLGKLTRHARAVRDAARAAAPGLEVATVAWLGYRTPSSLPTAAFRLQAERGGVALASTLAGMDAGRTATGNGPVRTTVVAHSYGTVVVDEAADAPGDLDADAVVLLGSPGMQGDAGALEAPEVYDAASPADPVSWMRWFGSTTWADGFGSTHLPADPGTGHSEYLDADRPTLSAVGEVLAGARQPA